MPKTLERYRTKNVALLKFWRSSVRPEKYGFILWNHIFLNGIVLMNHSLCQHPSLKNLNLKFKYFMTMWSPWIVNHNIFVNGTISKFQIWLANSNRSIFIFKKSEFLKQRLHSLKGLSKMNKYFHHKCNKNKYLWLRSWYVVSLP